MFKLSSNYNNITLSQNKPKQIIYYVETENSN
jgi:hypothetical protein